MSVTPAAGSLQSAARRVDERLMPAGTNARFALLLVLVLVSSARMCLDFSFPKTASRITECMLAAGADLTHPVDSATLIARTTQWYAYTACENRYAPPPPWWLTLGWPLLILLVAVLLFHADRRWKSREGRVTPLERYADGSADRVVKSLLRDAGLEGKAKLVYDASLSKSAMVFGSTRNPVLCLNRGLLVAFSQNTDRRAEDADRPTGEELLKGVVLHELAHIRYGDVTAARATIAVWRAFLLLALIPYLIWCVLLVLHGSAWTIWSTAGPIDNRALIATLALLALGYLARCDILRSREIYADLDAVRRGASTTIWKPLQRDTNPGPPAPGRRLATSFVQLWSTHPRWNLRNEALDDNRQLFLVQAVPVFLSGVAAALVYTNIEYFIEAYGQDGNWLTSAWAVQGASAFAAALVTVVVAVALWRAAAHRALTDPDRMPTGVRTGLWLGAGLVIGDLDSGQGTIDQLWPTRPEFLLAAVFAAVGFAWWTTQCARLWLARWRGRRLWPAMLPCLAGGLLLLSWWFFWWSEDGEAYAAGWYISPGESRAILLYTYAGPVVHSTVLTVTTWIQPTLSPLVLPAVDLLAVAGVWLAPLLAWMLRRSHEQARPWAYALDGAQDAWQTEGTDLPSLRTPMIIAAGGAVSSWAAVVGVQVFMHSSQPATPRLYGIYELTYWTLLFLAQLLPVVVVALLVSLQPGPYRLARTLIAAEAAALAGFAGLAALVSADGCISPLNTLETTCAWRPSLIPWGLHMQLDGVLVVGAVVSFLAAGLAATPAATPGLLRRVRGRTPRHISQQAAIASPRLPAARLTGPGLAVLALLASLGAAAAGIVEQWPRQISGQNIAAVQSDYRTAVTTTTQQAPPWEKAEQVRYWSELGGSAYITRFTADLQEMERRISADPTYPALPAEITSVCEDLRTMGGQAAAYFTVPDLQAQASWAAFVGETRAGAATCMSGLAEIRAKQYTEALPTMDSSFQSFSGATESGRAVTARINAVEAAGGDY
ncbi:MAG TPA: M48 family metalloprotease [Actinocrinis sp.]